MRKLIKLAAVAALATGVAAPALASQPGKNSAEFNNLRGYKYCEIFSGEPAEGPAGTYVGLTVWNTMGLNVCPHEEWSTVTTESAAHELGDPVALLNGPRMWVMDRIVFRDLGGHAEVGDLLWLDVASLRFADPSAVAKPYEPFTIERNSEWIYEANNLVFLLRDRNTNRTYVMQAYARQDCNGCDQISYMVNQDYSELIDLAYRLHLPDGWEYIPYSLNKSISLPTSPNSTRADKNPYYPQKTELATIVRDEFDNTYMLLTDDRGNPVDLSKANTVNFKPTLPQLPPGYVAPGYVAK